MFGHPTLLENADKRVGSITSKSKSKTQENFNVDIYNYIEMFRYSACRIISELILCTYLNFAC